MELGTALTFVGTRTGLSPTWARAGSGFAGDFLGEGRGVTISSTTHCGLPAGGLNRWIRTAMSLSGSMVPRCVDPNSFTSVTDMESFIVEKVVTEKNAFSSRSDFYVWTSLHCLGEFFFQARHKSMWGGG